MPLGEHVPIHNHLLGALPPAELRHLLPRLDRVDLPFKSVLLTTDGEIDAVWFVEAGTVSMLAELEDGARIEVGLIGPEGMVGLPLLLGADTSPVEALVQLPGAALRLSATAFVDSLADLPVLRGMLLRYAEAFHVQVAQTAACNGRHPIEQRLARWLLMTHDRARHDTFPMTQEFLSTMLGVRRPGVTVAVGILTRAGLICHGRGDITVLDRAGLEGTACECYAVVRRRYAKLAATRPGGARTSQPPVVSE